MHDLKAPPQIGFLLPIWDCYKPYILTFIYLFQVTAAVRTALSEIAGEEWV